VKKVVLLGASGLIAPNLLPGLEDHYEMSLADVKPHPDGRAVDECDVGDYAQVLQVTEGMDAIMNFTVIRDDAEQSFHVNTRGALNVMKAAVEHGIKKVIHSGPQFVRRTYDHDFDVADVPPVLGTDYYCLTKGLASEICRTYARIHGLDIISFVFNGLGPRPDGPLVEADFPPFTVVWEDLQQACRLALEIEAVPDGFQEFNLLSWEGHGKYTVDKARRLLGFEPTEDWQRYYARKP
jgi:nucleoside-diphosphate-sugar epimerase